MADRKRRFLTALPMPASQDACLKSYDVISRYNRRRCRQGICRYSRTSPTGAAVGDLYFYRVDGDLRGKVEKIETKVCPLYLLAGEYDFSSTPEDTKRTAAAIGGASVTIIKQLGHFPMSENPEQFRRYIAPVLNDILKKPTPSQQGVHV